MAIQQPLFQTSTTNASSSCRETIAANTIHPGDAIDLLRSLPDQCAGLVVADPPYSINKDFGPTTVKRNLTQWIEWSRIWLSEAARILASRGNIMIYSLHSSAAYLHVELARLGLAYRRQIIWHYENGFNTYRKAPPSEYEVILWFGRNENSTYHPLRKPYKSQERIRHKITKNGKLWQPHPEGRLEGDVWYVPTLAGRRFVKEKLPHPTQKPLELATRIVAHFSNPGELVVVPFVGSGTECIAASALERPFIGAEINPEYVELANRRLEEFRAHGIG